VRLALDGYKRRADQIGRLSETSPSQSAPLCPGYPPRWYPKCDKRRPLPSVIRPSSCVSLAVTESEFFGVTFLAVGPQVFDIKIPGGRVGIAKFVQQLET